MLYFNFLTLDPEWFSRNTDGLSAGRPGLDSRQCKICLFSTASRPNIGPTQPPIQLVLGALSPGVKRQGRVADHLAPTSAEVKQRGAIHPLSHVSPWHSVYILPFLMF
jgi:hypothetical protein